MIQSLLKKFTKHSVIILVACNCAPMTVTPASELVNPGHHQSERQPTENSLKDRLSNSDGVKTLQYLTNHNIQTETRENKNDSEPANNYQLQQEKTSQSNNHFDDYMRIKETAQIKKSPTRQKLHEGDTIVFSNTGAIISPRTMESIMTEILSKPIDEQTLNQIITYQYSTYKPSTISYPYYPPENKSLETNDLEFWNQGYDFENFGSTTESTTTN